MASSLTNLLHLDGAESAAEGVPAFIARTLNWWESVSSDLLAKGDDLQRTAGQEPAGLLPPATLLPEPPLGPIGPSGLRGPVQEVAPGPGAHVPPHLGHLTALPGRTRSHAGSVWGGAPGSVSGDSSVFAAPQQLPRGDELEGAHGAAAEDG